MKHAHKLGTSVPEWKMGTSDAAPFSTVSMSSAGHPKTWMSNWIVVNFSAARKRHVARLKPKSKPAILMVGVYRLAWSHKRRSKGIFSLSEYSDLFLLEESVVEEESFAPVTRHMFEKGLEDCYKRGVAIVGNREVYGLRDDVVVVTTTKWHLFVS